MVRAITPVLVVVAAAIIPLALSMVAKHHPGVVRFLPGGARWTDKHFTRWVTETFMLGALFAVIAALLMRNRVGRAQSLRLIRQGLTLKMAALVVGVCVLKGMLDASNTAESIAAFLKSTGLPIPVVIGSIVFVVGMLLGYTLGFVGICYPMLDAMLRLPGGELNYPLAAFTFACGFLGVMLSPVHLCLVLSREHFDAGWGGVYRKLLPPTLLVFGVACLMLLWA